MNKFIKHIIALAATSVCKIDAAYSLEKGKFYVSGNYGIILYDKFDYKDREGLFTIKKTKNSNIIGSSIGYSITDNIRTAISYSMFHRIKYKFKSSNLITYSQKVSSNALFTSTYYDISNFSKVKPYITTSVGVVNFKAGDLKIGVPAIRPVTFRVESKSQFAWQLGTGVNYVVNNKTYFNLANYHYSDLGKINLKGKNASSRNKVPVLHVKLKAHNLSIGVVFNFN